MNTIPSPNDLWAGIGGHFDSFSQIVAEFIDNSIGNLEANGLVTRNVVVKIEQIDDGVEVSIEDTGTGITNFEAALRLGDRTACQSTRNEHGFGMKHALASANPSNDKWWIFSRTESDYSDGVFQRLQAPYAFNMDLKELKVTTKNPWPGQFNGSGTFIKFCCSESMFFTLRIGIQGKPGFKKCLEYLNQEIGYIYAGVIEKGSATISIQSKSASYNESVAAIKPSWADFYDPGEGETNIDLGSGKVRIEYKFGEMKESKHSKHYKRNMDTSGLELRINGRVMMSNIFKEVWHRENHPSYNHFLVIVNLISDETTKLPKTRTSKNGIRSGDEKLERLFEWIRSTHPTPPKDLAGASTERALVEELKKNKEAAIFSPEKCLEIEFEVFKTINSPVASDLYVFDGQYVLLYEAKKDYADIVNLYQLLLYWDGAVADGINPKAGILVAKDFAAGVEKLIAILNARKDEKGNNYNFIKKTWQEEGVKYPKI
jgi:hypothetical protein